MKIHHASIKKAAKFHITLSLEDNEVVATAKDGTRLASGLQGNKVLEDAITKQTGKPAKGNGVKKPEKLVFKPVAKKARKPKVEDDEELDPSDDEIEAEDDSDASQSRSVVKQKYKTKYKPTKDKCGDDLSFEVNKHVSRENDAGEMQVERKALEKFAKANGVWVTSYGSFVNRSGTFNSGMALMCVNNRLRAKVRQAAKAEEVFEIKWV